MIQLTDSLGRLQGLGSAGWDAWCWRMQLENVCAELSPLWENSCAGTHTTPPQLDPVCQTCSINFQKWVDGAQLQQFLWINTKSPDFLLLNIVFPRVPALGLQSSTQRYCTRKQARVQTS